MVNLKAVRLYYGVNGWRHREVWFDMPRWSGRKRKCVMFSIWHPNSNLSHRLFNHTCRAKIDQKLQNLGCRLQQTSRLCGRFRHRKPSRQYAIINNFSTTFSQFKRQLGYRHKLNVTVANQLQFSIKSEQLGNKQRAVCRHRAAREPLNTPSITS